MTIEGRSDAKRGGRIRLGMVGGGEGACIGAVHRIAARIDDQYELVAGALSSIAVKTMCALIAIGRSLSAANGRKSRAASASRLAVTTGSSRWLSTLARPWPGMCLTTGTTPPARRPSQ